MKLKNKKMLATLCSLVTAFSLVACNQTDEDPSQLGSDPSGNDSDLKTVTFAKELDIISMDSSYATDGSSFEAIHATIEGLLTVDADGNLIPALATDKAVVSKDGTTYTYTLKDAKWDNGDAVTADDFVYAWQRTVSSPDAEYSYLYTEDGACVLNAAEVMSGDKKVFDI